MFRSLRASDTQLCPGWSKRFMYFFFNLHFLFQNIVNGVEYECIQDIIYNTMIEGLVNLIEHSSVKSNYITVY